MADQEGLFEVRPPRPIQRNISNEPWPQDSFDDEQWEEEAEEFFEDNDIQNVELNDSSVKSDEDKEKNNEKPDID